MNDNYVLCSVAGAGDTAVKKALGELTVQCAWRLRGMADNK